MFAQILQVIKNLILITICIFIIIVVYTIWDNNRIVVVRQEVEIDNLPESFEDYKILLLSDLHGKRFGESQQYITGIINELDYDVIVIAGDMQEHQTDGIEPLLELLRGIDRYTPIFYVAGNNGPFDSVKETGEILDDGQTLLAEGVTLITLPVRIDRGEQHIWFVPVFSNTLARYYQEKAQEKIASVNDPDELAYYKTLLSYQTELLQAFEAINPDEVLICINHEPLFEERLNNPAYMPPYDLVLAGHYHGGQYRLPFIGAIFLWGVPSDYHGFFPDDDHISGLFQGDAMQQFISRGLGSNGYKPIFRFRLFNTPEINLLTLTNAANSN